MMIEKEEERKKGYAREREGQNEKRHDDIERGGRKEM